MMLNQTNLKKQTHKKIAIVIVLNFQKMDYTTYKHLRQRVIDERGKTATPCF